MKIKQKLRKWLEIPTDEGISLKVDKAAEAVTKKIVRDFEIKIANISPKQCISCEKLLVNGKDAIYTNSMGQTFCSHECIDLNKGEKVRNE